MSNGQIFISYRREDSAGYARALYERLVQHFSKERVFMDVDAIEPGIPFDEAIKSALDQCVVQNTSGLLIQDMRPDINGEWEADVSYDWPNAKYVEKFDFRGSGDEVYGTASFLGGKKAILEGSIRKDGLRFITKTQELLGGDSKSPRDVVHRYRGEFLETEIKFIMQTEGGYSERIPIEFIAKKVPPPSHQPIR